MSRVMALLTVVLCASSLEGLWAWLLTASLAELDGQAAPPLGLVTLLLGGSWLAGRLFQVARVPPAHRRLALVGGGLVVALAAGTIHAGLLHPLQLITGQPTPDYRGSASALALVFAYLWGRGLGLAAGVNRERIVSHIVVSILLLANILVVLPLTSTVQRFGGTIVVVWFFLAIAALLLVQLAHAESHRVTRLQWAALGAATTLGLVVSAAGLTGALSLANLSGLGQPIGRFARIASPLTDSFLLGLGYIAQAVTHFLIWLRQLYGTDPETTRQVQREAEEARFPFDLEGSYGPPEIMTIVATVVIVAFVGYWFLRFFARMVQLGERRHHDDVQEEHEALGRAAGSGLAGLMGRLARVRTSSDRGGLAGPAGEIRRHYRALQALMARADLPRAASQTPREYEAYLAARLPAGEGPLATITDAYILARYAPPGQPLPDPERVGAAVRQVREALRQGETAAPDPGLPWRDRAATPAPGGPEGAGPTTRRPSGV